MQAKLLRALQERVIERVGGSRERSVDSAHRRRRPIATCKQLVSEAVPARSLLPAERRPPSCCRAAASASTTCASSPAISRAASTRRTSATSRSRTIDRGARALRLAGERAASSRTCSERVVLLADMAAVRASDIERRSRRRVARPRPRGRSCANRRQRRQPSAANRSVSTSDRARIEDALAATPRNKSAAASAPRHDAPSARNTA